jgi:hypothetical protein
MKKIIVSIALILLGIAILIIPNFTAYIDTGSFYFDLSTFLKDYPAFTYPVGIIALISGIFYSLFIIFDSIRNNTIFIIQKADKEDYGDIDLHFPNCVIGGKDELVYENLITLSNHEKNVIDLEKKKIKNFYGRISLKKTIAFLAISPMPTIVYAGYCVGNVGRKVSFYHWNRDKNKAIRLKEFGGKANLQKEDIIKTQSMEFVVCVSTSYLIEKESVKNQFTGYNIIFLKANNPNYNFIKTKKDLVKVADYVRETISNLPVGSRVHLLLCCSSELCFAVGQRLNSPALPTVKVYSFDKNVKGTKTWNWGIDLD